MRKIMLACIIFWVIVICIAAVCCGNADVSEAAEIAVDRDPVELGIVHLAGIDTDLVLNLTESDKPEPEPQMVSLGTFKITAYCPCEKCCGKNPSDPAYGITATGTVATEGRTIAADPRVIHYGTELYIDGQAYIVEDCGGAIKGNHIDLFFDSHQDALNWGVQEREVYIYE